MTDLDDAILRTYTNEAVRDMQRDLNRVFAQQIETLAYRHRKPTRAERLRMRLSGLARRPFEALRDHLVSWLGCNCDCY